MTDRIMQWLKTHWELSVLGVLLIATIAYWRPDVVQALQGLVAFFAIGAAMLFGYFLPTYVAVRRHHHNRQAIAVLNVCLGWTLIGWVIALVWAYTSPGPIL